jgi:hypothetical protein
VLADGSERLTVFNATGAASVLEGQGLALRYLGVATRL